MWGWLSFQFTFKGSRCLTHSLMAGGRGYLELRDSVTVCAYSVAVHACTVCLCVYSLFGVCAVAELWAFWGFQSSSALLYDREGEAQSQTVLRS